jgi:hypothetical protein
LDYRAEVKRRAEQARVAREAEKKMQEQKVAESQPPFQQDSLRERSAVAIPLKHVEAPPQGVMATAEGIIENVSCKWLSLKMALVLRSYTLELRSPDYRRIDFRALGWTPPDPLLPCKQITGMKAKVVYTAGGADAGEIVSIELRK